MQLLVLQGSDRIKLSAALQWRAVYWHLEVFYARKQWTQWYYKEAMDAVEQRLNFTVRHVLERQQRIIACVESFVRSILLKQLAKLVDNSAITCTTRKR